jgi:hypothetical protein
MEKEKSGYTLVIHEAPSPSKRNLDLKEGEEIIKKSYQRLQNYNINKYLLDHFGRQAIRLLTSLQYVKH